MHYLPSGSPFYQRGWIVSKLCLSGPPTVPSGSESFAEGETSSEKSYSDSDTIKLHYCFNSSLMEHPMGNRGLQRRRIKNFSLTILNSCFGGYLWKLNLLVAYYYPPTNSVILKIGKNSAITIAPITIPKKAITNGSIIETNPLTAASTCSS